MQFEKQMFAKIGNYLGKLRRLKKCHAPAADSSWEIKKMGVAIFLERGMQYLSSIDKIRQSKGKSVNGNTIKNVRGKRDILNSSKLSLYSFPI
jgi:hypothetical protein